jgi:hypothetical protein
MYSTDDLKKIAKKRPSFCGTGAIKLKTTEGTFRFYNEKLIPRHNREIHSHTYGFKSQIVKGTLRHIFYDVVESEEETQYQLTEGECRKGCPPEVIAENVNIIEILRTDMCAGTEYTICPEMYHEVDFVTDSVVTIINPFIKGPTPRFVRDKSIGYICPWGDTMLSAAECWEIIDTMLAES